MLILSPYCLPFSVRNKSTNAKCGSGLAGVKGVTVQSVSVLTVLLLPLGNVTVNSPLAALELGAVTVRYSPLSPAAAPVKVISRA